MKNKAFMAVAFTGALLLGGCAADASTAPAGSDSATATVEPTAPRKTFAVAMPDPRGIEVSSIILDPSLDVFPPDTGPQVQTQLQEFFAAVESFPELQKGDRPTRPEDTKIIEPTLKPLMSDWGWDAVVRLMKDSQTLPTWYLSGNPFDRFIYEDGETPLDESERPAWTPDEDGYTLIFSSEQPITLTTMQYEDGTMVVQAKNIQYRSFFRNVQGDVNYVSIAQDFTFRQGPDGKWLLELWDRSEEGPANGGGGIVASQKELDQLMTGF